MANWWRMVRRLAMASFRSQLSYRASFAADFFAQGLLGLTEFLELYVLISVAPVFGGMTGPQAILVYSIAHTAFGLVDLVFGQLDRTNEHIKRGTLDVYLTRPASLLLQLSLQDVQLRRLGRVATALPIMVFGVIASGMALTFANFALLILAVLGGFLILGAAFAAGGAFLFYVLDGSQAANAFIYGGKYAAGFPGATLLTPVKILFTFVMPATLIAYVPAAVLTGATLPSFWWPPVSWLTVPIGLLLWAGALFLWRQAIKHYTGAGG